VARNAATRRLERLVRRPAQPVQPTPARCWRSNVLSGRRRHGRHARWVNARVFQALPAVSTLWKNSLSTTSCEKAAGRRFLPAAVKSWRDLSGSASVSGVRRADRHPADLVAGW
jgi:hypothetical protein